MPPPPPPPMPPMGRGAGGPPPPPPMPGMPGMKAPGGKAKAGAGRGALLADISGGARLRKVGVVNDRSAPIMGKVSDAPSVPAIGGAPPVPGMGRAPAPPSGRAPPPPGNRVRSNSDTAGDGASSVAPPKLGGLFAGGMPKLRKTGGVKTGAETSSPHLSDPESSRHSILQPPKLPRGAAPKPPGSGPLLPGARPPNQSIAALRNSLRPSSMVSTHSMPDMGSKARHPPPVGKKPPMPPPPSRKPSGFAPLPPASPARPPPLPGSVPPPPPSSAPRPFSLNHTPSAPPPPPPPSAAPRRPSGRATPPPPPPFPPKAPPHAQSDEDDEEYDPYRTGQPATPAPSAPKASTSGHHSPSLAEQAARNAFRGTPSAPPPPPPASTPPSAPSAAAPSPVMLSQQSRAQTQPPMRSLLDSSSYTLSNGGSGNKSGPTSPGVQHSGGGGAGQKGKIVPIHDLRWRFQDEGQFPKPREFSGGPKKYRAGRGSSVPLDLSAYE